MNIFAFLLVAIAGVIGVIGVIQSRARDLVSWALVALATGIIVELVFDVSHSVHA